MKDKKKIFFLNLMIIFTLNIIIPSNQSVQAASFLTHTYHGQLTGADAVSDSTTYDVKGTDLGIIVKHDGKYYYIFGDTFGFPDTYSNWRSNTIAYSTDTNLSDGVTLDGWIVNIFTGNAKELISSAKVDYDEMTCIPTAAVSYDGNIYIYYMSVRHWGTEGGTWTCNNASIAVSTNDGQTFTKMNNVSWSGAGNFVQFAMAQKQSTLVRENYLYLLATPSGRFGDCYLCRVLKANMLDQSKYEYYSGLDEDDIPIWESSESGAQSIFSSPVGELSIMWNEYLNKWTVFYFDEDQNAVVVRTADRLWGSWSSTKKIVGATEYPSLYGSFIHQDLVENDGQTVYFVMSIYSSYNTYIMSVDFSSLTETTTTSEAKCPIVVGSFIAIVMTSAIVKKKECNKRKL